MFSCHEAYQFFFLFENLYFLQNLKIFNLRPNYIYSIVVKKFCKQYRSWKFKRIYTIFFSFTIFRIKSHAYSRHIFRKFNSIRKYFICLIFCECTFVAFRDFIHTHTETDRTRTRASNMGTQRNIYNLYTLYLFFVFNLTYVKFLIYMLQDTKLSVLNTIGNDDGTSSMKKNSLLFISARIFPTRSLSTMRYKFNIHTVKADRPGCALTFEGLPRKWQGRVGGDGWDARRR